MSYAGTDIYAAYLSTLNDRVDRLERVEVTNVPIINMLSRGALTDGTDTRQVIQDAITVAEAMPGPVTLLFPRGDYTIDSFVGSGRGTSSLLIQGTHITLRGEPGARLLFTNGSAIRPFIVRNSTTVKVVGLELIYARTDGAAAVGLNIENSSDINVETVRFEDWTFYGLGVSEDTSAANLTASTFSFEAATHRIKDSAGQFLPASGWHVGTVTVAASLENDGMYTVTFVDPAGAFLQVLEPLVDEAAGASSIAAVSSTISFSSVDRTIRTTDVNFSFFPENGQVAVSGSAANDDTYTIVDIDPTGQIMAVLEPLVDEAAGAAITLTKVGKPNIGMQIATACDNLRIHDCDFIHIGLYGIEAFPKRLSRDLFVTGNRFYDCGYITGTGAGCKAGQLTVNAIITANVFAHCVNAIIAGQWERNHIFANSIVNSYCFGVAVTASNHPKSDASHASLLVDENHIGYVDDYISGVLFDPSAPNTIDPSRRTFSRSYGAININGALDALLGAPLANGPITFARNELHRWGAGLTFYKSVMPIPHVSWIDNHVVDCGLSGVTEVRANGTVTAGSAVITGVVTDGTPGVGGWFRNTPIIGDTAYIPAGTTIVDLDPFAQTITMSTPALAGAPTTIGLRSSYPLELQTFENVFEDTSNTSGNIIRLYSEGGNHVGNKIIGYGPYALQMKGDGSRLEQPLLKRINQINTASRSPILLNERGTYTIIDATVEIGNTAATGFAQYMVTGAIAPSVGPGIYGLGGVIYLSALNNKSTLTALFPMTGCTIAPMLPWRSDAATRTIATTAAPTSGGWFAGDRAINTAPTPTLNIAEWLCVAGGPPGTWQALGLGHGTAAARPTPLLGDAGYLYWSDDTAVLNYWNGTAWVIITNNAANVALLNAAQIFTATQQIDIGDTSTAGKAAVLSLHHHLTSGTPVAGFGQETRRTLDTTTAQYQSADLDRVEWGTATGGSQKARRTFYVYDTIAREAMRLESSGTAGMIGVLGAAASGRITVTGSRGGNAALASLLTAMATFGWITDSTTV